MADRLRYHLNETQVIIQVTTLRDSRPQPTMDGFTRDIQALRTGFPDFTLTIEDIVSKDDMVWARATGRGTHLGPFMGPPTGKSIAVTVLDVCRFEDGKICEHWGVPDRFTMLMQLGLLPKPQKV